MSRASNGNPSKHHTSLLKSSSMFLAFIILDASYLTCEHIAGTKSDLVKNILQDDQQNGRFESNPQKINGSGAFVLLIYRWYEVIQPDYTQHFFGKKPNLIMRGKTMMDKGIRCTDQGGCCHTNLILSRTASLISPLVLGATNQSILHQRASDRSHWFILLPINSPSA